MELDVREDSMREAMVGWASVGGWWAVDEESDGVVYGWRDGGLENVVVRGSDGGQGQRGKELRPLSKVRQGDVDMQRYASWYPMGKGTSKDHQS